MADFPGAPRRPSSPSPEEAARRSSPSPPRIAQPPPPRGPVPPPRGPMPPRGQMPPPGARPWTAPSAGTAPAAAASTAPAAAKVADEEEEKPDLTATKVIAGAGAAATSAVMGSYLGATGTVAGAALGSVVSMVGTSVYQHYLERTRDTVRARVRLPGGQTIPVTQQLEVPAPRSADDADAAPTHVLVTPVNEPYGGPVPGVPASRAAGPSQPTRAGTGGGTVAPVVARPRRRRRWVAVGVAVALSFLVGMLVVTGLEWLKGSTLTSGQSGTSVGRVLEGGDRGPATSQKQGTEDTSATTEPSPSESSTTTSPKDTSSSSSRAPGRSNSSPTTSSEPTTTSPLPSAGVGPTR